MKIKSLIRILIISFLLFIVQIAVCVQTSNAAVEIKPGTEIFDEINISNSFQTCYDMRIQTSSLGNNKLDPHLAKATDWGITTYLGLSSYGAVKSETGPTVTIDSTSYTSTTGNKTGVMNFGKNKTWTAHYKDGTSSDADREKLYLSSNSKYVDILDSTNTAEGTKGEAYGEVSGWFSTSQNYDGPIMLREGFVSSSRWTHRYLDSSTGQGWESITFRPVIWN